MTSSLTILNDIAPTGHNPNFIGNNKSLALDFEDYNFDDDPGSFSLKVESNVNTANLDIEYEFTAFKYPDLDCMMVKTIETDFNKEELIVEATSLISKIKKAEEEIRVLCGNHDNIGISAVKDLKARVLRGGNDISPATIETLNAIDGFLISHIEVLKLRLMQRDLISRVEKLERRFIINQADIDDLNGRTNN